MRQRFAGQIHTNPVFATQYLAYDLESEPFNNADVRRAFYYAINREELTSTVLKDIAIPAGSLLAPGFPGYSENIASQAVFDPQKAKDFLAKAGYPNGEGFPTVEVWFREEGGYNGAILPPMAQYLQAQFKEILGITMNIKVMPGKEWMEGLLSKKNNLFLSPYEYDYLDPSNFYGIFFNGGRHDYHNAEYDRLVAEADSHPVWEERVKLYEQAEQVMIDEALIVPITHPVTMNVVSDKLGGEAMTPNKQGFYPNWSGYVYTHLTKN
jgi:oligopeptide transport system substrate-binding protein